MAVSCAHSDQDMQCVCICGAENVANMLENPVSPTMRLAESDKASFAKTDTPNGMFIHATKDIVIPLADGLVVPEVINAICKSCILQSSTMLHASSPIRCVQVSCWRLWCFLRYFQTDNAIDLHMDDVIHLGDDVRCWHEGWVAKRLPFRVVAPGQQLV